MFSESRFSITIDTRFLDDDGTTENALELSPDELSRRSIGANQCESHSQIPFLLNSTVYSLLLWNESMIASNYV